MPTLAEIEASLPWGLHDAVLEGLALDFARSTLRLDVRLMMTRPQDMDQRASVLIESVAWCVLERPDAGDEQLASRISFGEASTMRNAPPPLPPVPTSCTAFFVFIHDWSSFIYFAGGDATLVWTEPAPLPARSDSRALFPGDEITHPE